MQEKDKNQVWNIFITNYEKHLFLSKMYVMNGIIVGFHYIRLAREPELSIVHEN